MDTAPIWTIPMAIHSLPFVRPLLRQLREAHCRLCHLRRLVRKAAAPDPELSERLVEAEGEVDGLLREVAQAGFYVWEHVARGIALFPSLLQAKDRELLPVLFVCRDTRRMFSSYVVTADLLRTNDLIGCERPIPKAWMETGT